MNMPSPRTGFAIAISAASLIRTQTAYPGSIDLTCKWVIPSLHHGRSGFQWRRLRSRASSAFADVRRWASSPFTAAGP